MAIEYYRSTATKLFGGPTAGEPDGIPILDAASPECRDLLFPNRHRPAGSQVGFGYDPGQYVQDMFAAPSGMQTIPESEWDARYDEQEATQSSLEHLYLKEWRGDCLDQNGQGYCWSYSVHSAVMLRRLALNFPFVRLNPHAIASLIKNGADEGGWCGLSLSRMREIGCAAEGTGPTDWPLHGYGRQLNQRWNDAAFKAAALRFQVTDDWYDLGKPVYSQSLKDSQLATCLFNACPAALDFNEWAHSVGGVRWVRVERGLWCPLILNSWKGWGRRGLAVIRNWKPAGAVAVVNSRAA